MRRSVEVPVRAMAVHDTGGMSRQDADVVVVEIVAVHHHAARLEQPGRLGVGDGTQTRRPLEGRPPTDDLQEAREGAVAVQQVARLLLGLGQVHGQRQAAT